MPVIKSFHDKDTKALFNRRRVPRFQSFERAARRKLAALHAATDLRDLKGGGSQLEKLTKDRAGQYAFRINDQWPVCFHQRDHDAYEVEIADYH
jgi:proteic killer suppression protein